MKTIVVSSQKGGCGKTMLAAHLAVEIHRSKDGPAWLIDTDKQGTLSRWFDAREADEPRLLDVRISALRQELAGIANAGAAYCVIDTSPTISDQSRSLIELADLVVIPVRPSSSDLWAVGHTVELVRSAGKRFLFVITQSHPTSTMTPQVMGVLSRHGEVCPATIGNRIIYAAAMTDGSTASEVDARSRAADEIKNLWKCIKESIHETTVRN